MSGHGDHDDAHAEDDHDDDHHAAPVLEEPATPLWLSLLGVGLFLAAGILFIATRSDGKTTAELTTAPSDQNAAAAAASAAPRPNAPPNPPGSPPPAARPTPAP